MKIDTFKKRLIQILFVFAVLAVVINVLADQLVKKPVHTKLVNISSNSVNVKFLNALNDFGLQKDWIKSIIDKKQGSADYQYNVEIPKDLPIPEVLAEIYGTFNQTKLKLKCVEEVTGGKSLLNISSGRKPVLSAELNYDTSITRNAGSIGILIENFDKLNKKNTDALIEFPQTFAALLVPSKYSLNVKDSLLNNRKEYAVLLNDKISDITYQLGKNFSRNRLRLALRSIIGAFPNAIFYIIDNKSSLYNSAAYSFIENEFSKRKIFLFSTDSFTQIEEGSKSFLTEQLNRIVRPTRAGDKKLILIHADDFDLLKPEIFSLIKIGYKFINPSLIVSMKHY